MASNGEFHPTVAAKRKTSQQVPRGTCGLVRLGIAALLAVCVASSLLVLVPAPARAEEDSDGLRVVGQMERRFDRLRRPMAVDETRSLGFVLDTKGDLLHMMDLERLVPLASTPQRSLGGGQSSGYTPESALALDSVRERLYANAGYPTVENPNASDNRCRPDLQSATPQNGMPVFEYRARSDGGRTLVQKRMGPMPCSGRFQFFGLTNSYDQTSDRLYLGGTAGTEGWRYQPSDIGVARSAIGGTLQDDRGASLLIRQLAIGDGPLVEFSNSAGTGAAQLHLEWEVDLRLAGCGRRQHVDRGVFEGFVARLGNDVLAYCWDTRAYRGLQQGQQGFLVRIPLAPDPANPTVMKPLTRGAPVLDDATGQITNYVYRRMPTLPGDVTPIMDRKSGRLILVTSGRVNGNAVWVFDPKGERFVGVITGGYADEPPGNSAVGFDSARGRVYLLTRHGILIAPIRKDPLPSGLIYPVLINKTGTPDFVTSNRISVAPALGRLFVAVNDHPRTSSLVDPNPTLAPDHYEVLEDDVPDPPGVKPVDPDALTTQVAEEDGKTASSTSGQAIASGAHVVNTGGLSRAVGQNDPSCFFSPPNIHQPPDPGAPQGPIPDWEIAPRLFGACLPELVVSTGHREVSVAATELEAGTGTGATARGAVVAVGSTDSGTDGDVRRASDCGVDAPDRVDQWGRQWPFPDAARLNGGTNSDFTTPVIGGGDKKDEARQYNDARDAFWNSWASQREAGQGDYQEGCNTFQDSLAGVSAQSPSGPIDLRAGVRGADGKGFPIPAAVCGDFGGHPTSETWPAQAAGQPQVGDPTSSATCDASVPGARGDASAGALAVPSATDPQLSVARVWSKVSSARTEEGQVTMALAVAEGVTAGPLSIAQVRSLAITTAHGHTDTASALLVRQWCGLSVEGQTQQGCVDPDSQQAKDLLDEVSAALLQKVQLSVPEGATQATPKGYQAVVTKSPGQRGADQTVNDDDSHTVAALQAIVYNDGPRGRSRLIVQLAGVHAESRYGIIQLPNFGGGSFGEPDADAAPTEREPDPAPGEPVAEVPPAPAPPADPFTPESFVEEEFGPTEQGRFSPAPVPKRTLPVAPAHPLRRIVRVPVQILSDAINLLVQNPREAALLFVMWALLAAPLYLGLRRRSFARALVIT